jgi:tRNA-Thr(GGU) m(6)t(6)A37 methyltransferase TsaA
VLTLEPWVGGVEVIRGLEGFSHLWVLFWFHHARDRKVVVRPPRLKGKKKVGIFATRAPHRPNPLGLSVFPLLKTEIIKSRAVLTLGSVDLVDGTPVFDIKPYLPYSDAIPAAASGWAEEPIARLPVAFAVEPPESLKALLTELLSLDPRPNSHHKRERPEYVLSVAGHEVRWSVSEAGVVVTGVALKEAAEKVEKIEGEQSEEEAV